jgi:hypothetical protein
MLFNDLRPKIGCRKKDHYNSRDFLKCTVVARPDRAAFEK